MYTMFIVIPFSPTPSPSLTTTGLSSPPRSPISAVQRHGQENATITLHWQRPQYDGGAPVSYIITVHPGFSPITTNATNVAVIVPYNVRHTVSIVATNCIGDSSAEIVIISAFGELSQWSK